MIETQLNKLEQAKSLIFEIEQDLFEDKPNSCAAIRNALHRARVEINTAININRESPQ